MKLQGKVAIVTGAAGGIGFAIARRFLQEGCKVAIADIDNERGSKAERDLSGFGAARFVKTDVGRRLDVHNLVAATVAEFGDIDVLVSNAGIAHSQSFLDVSEEDFDAGAKYHVPGNTPYTRYFLARILQFQFYRSLCQSAGHQGPLHTCSFFGSKEAGDRFWAMLAEGQSKPWPETLAKLTGDPQMDASAIVDYFQPLMGYLKEQNQARSCGWAQ